VYKEQFNKEKFELNLLGGEPTMWPELADFVRNLKAEYGDDLIIGMTTNGSRTLRWWQENGKMFDKILISCHPETVDAEHISQVADLLYDQRTFTDVTVLMDPTQWNTCLEIIDTLKNSNRRWSIQTSQLVGTDSVYSEEQQRFLKKYLKRMPNLWWMWRYTKHFNYKTKLIDKNKKTLSVSKNYLLINDLNHFKGWECDIGIENINISFTGDISSACGEFLYRYDFKYNLYDKDFIAKFNPSNVSAICTRDSCFCQYEINTSKRIIPIKYV
jgi:organic radical activating enzyme